MRLNGFDRQSSTRSPNREERKEKRTENAERLRSAFNALKGVKYVRKKKTRGRVGPQGKVLALVSGWRVLVLFPHQRRPESLHVLAVEPVVDPVGQTENF